MLRYRKRGVTPIADEPPKLVPDQSAAPVTEPSPRVGDGELVLKVKAIAPTRAARFSVSRTGLGWVPAMAASSALGLLLVAIGDAHSRETTTSSQRLFWIGLLVIYTPVAFRLASTAAARHERLLLVVELGLVLYLVKVFFEPFAFTFADELVHAANVNAILRHHELFTANSIIPVTPYYPGLEAVTAGLAAMTGLSVFGAGIIIIGVSRILMMLALFLLFERLSGSARVAGIGTGVYAANSNFVFFDAQFSYESLALPLLLVALFAVAEWRAARKRSAWAVTALLLTMAIVVTHHVTSYLLIVLLIGICAAYVIVARDRLHDAPWYLTAFALVVTTAWLVGVAEATVGYLLPVLRGAFVSTFRTLQGQAAPRELFVSTGYQPPVIERVVGILSVLLPFIALPFGLRTLWRKHRTDPFALVLGTAAVAFFGSIILRYAPAAWETANRASEFLFIGLAFVLGMAGIAGRRRVVGAAFAATFFGVVFAGGVIDGWTPQLRLAQPYRIDVDGRTIDAEGPQMARFAEASHLAAGGRFAASEADGRLLAAYASGYVFVGGKPDVNDILRTPDLPPWELALLDRLRIRFVVVDRRERSFDNTAGYYFGVRGRFGMTDVLYPPDSVNKFDAAGFSRIYDSGNIVVFDRGTR